MQTPEQTAEISSLEEQLRHHQQLLDKAFADNLQFAETKVIFKKVKQIFEKLKVLKEDLPAFDFEKAKLDEPHS